MKKYDQRHIENWPNVKERGRKSYALRYSLFTTIGILLMKVIDYFTFNSMETENIWITLVSFGLFWFISSFLISYFVMWYVEDNHYKDLIKKLDNESKFDSGQI
jgi:hypothetical protein